MVGAGAAGLAAALALAQSGRNVVVLEARDRVGGRVHARAPHEGLQAAELGAEFIHGSASRTMALLREAGETTVPIDGERFVRGDDGELRRSEDEFGPDADLLRGVDALPEDVSLAEYLARVAQDPAMRERSELARFFAEGFDAADPKRASMLAMADEWRSGVDAQSLRPGRGYAPLVHLLEARCRDLGVDLHLNAPVDSIRWNADGVTVGTLQAKTGIVTVPAAVLRSGAIVFDPPLPEAKRRALASIESGHVVKVNLWFRTRFWENLRGGLYRDAAFFMDAAQRFPTYWAQPAGSQVVAWAAGPSAIRMLGLSREQLVDSALTGFDALFGGAGAARDAYVAGDLHDWNGDPFAMGAYSYILVGGRTARADLAEPLDGTLFFAGEATARGGEGGTVNGAIESGERAAREVLAQ